MSEVMTIDQIVLEDAYHTLAEGEHRWSAKGWSRADGKGGCLLWHLKEAYKAIFNDVSGDPVVEDGVLGARSRAEMTLTATIIRRTGLSTTVAEFNDDEHTTYEDALLALKEAAFG